MRKRRAAARERGRKLVEVARARARKLVEVARARARTLLEVASRPRVRVVVKEAKPSTKRRTKATPKPKPKVRPVKPTPPPDYESAFLAALRKVTGRSQGLISIGDVRSASGLPKSVFDALAVRLMRERRLVMHEHDFPSSLSAAMRAQLVEDGKGRVFIGMALPAEANQLPESKLLNKARLYGAGAPVRIASLRKDVGLTPGEFDLALGALQRLGKVALYRDDNRATAKDEGAYFLAGEPRHILYVR
ncbi:MAG: hypothetical protein WC381_11450 [Kiritimatiellia bacterium]|jgi:hypothetical protein